MKKYKIKEIDGVGWLAPEESNWKEIIASIVFGIFIGFFFVMILL
jgi:hypothetical protein